MLRFRPYKTCDAAAVISWIPDETAFRKWSADRYDHYPITPGDINAMYDAQRDTPTFFPMTAFDESGIVGHMIMRFTDEAQSELRFGFVIVDSGKRGMGYGKEMLHLALKYAFELMKVRRVTLGVFENNPAAYHCYRAVGFRDMTLPEPKVFCVLGQRWNCLELEMTAEEYMENR